MNKFRELAIKYYKKSKPTILDSEIGSRLPEAYKKFYREWVFTPGEPVHYIPYTGKKWVRDETTGEIKRCENNPIPTRFPKELHNIFTGGELVVQGFIRKGKYCHRIPRFWMPVAFRSAIYSEILDKYFSVLLTKRAIELIHKHQGLDTYILSTKACDLKTLVALGLKRQLLLALSNKNLPYDDKKNEEIFKKYEQYLVPPEEIEWYGLSFSQACKKLEEIEKAQAVASVRPFKEIFRTQLIQQLKENSIRGEKKDNTVINSSVLDKVRNLTPFGFQKNQ